MEISKVAELQVSRIQFFQTDFESNGEAGTFLKLDPIFLKLGSNFSKVFAKATAKQGIASTRGRSWRCRPVRSGHVGMRSIRTGECHGGIFVGERGIDLWAVLSTAEQSSSSGTVFLRSRYQKKPQTKCNTMQDVLFSNLEPPPDKEKT